METRPAERPVAASEKMAFPAEESGISHAVGHRLYSSAYNAVREIGRLVAANHQAGICRSLRAVQDITDAAMHDPAVLLGFGTIHDNGDQLYLHSVNVAMMSTCLGQRIGLSRKKLVGLGLCGLFHDLGKLDIPPDILLKPGPLAHAESEKIGRHPGDAVRRIMHLKAPRDLVTGLILPAFEHHRKYDHSGYPEVDWSRPPGLFGRIISICDVYDALTAPRAYRPIPLSPDSALGVLAKKGGTWFDPVLVKWFYRMMGAIPVGTFVRLNTGETGLVSDGGDAGVGRSPKVLLLRQDSSGRFATGGTIELNGSDASGQPPRSIRETHHPFEFGIQPAVCFMEAESR